MRRFARASQRFGSQVQCGLPGSPGSTPLITAARDSTQWRPLSSASSLFAEHYDIPHIPHIPDGLDQFPRWDAISAAISPDAPATAALGMPEAGQQPPEQKKHAPLKQKHLKTFWTIVRDGQPDQVMDALMDPRFEGLVVSMPSSTFAEVLLLLSPAYFIEPFRALHRPLHPATVHVKGYKRLEVIFEEFAHNLSAVVRTRRSAGHKLGLAEYTHLLHCASSIGDGLMAEQTWQSMGQDDVRPDLSCYNHLMAAKVWDSAYTSPQKYRLRTTKHVYRKRGFVYPNPGWTGFGTKGRSVRKEVVRLLNEMVENGFQGDENTYIHVLTASARVGDSSGIKRLLKAIWNVDVDALLNREPDSVMEPVTPFPRTHPLFPTKNLLFAIAHTFGTTSEMLAALRTIDHISESYGIETTEEVWLELMERAFVLSRQRWGPDLEGKNRGLLPSKFLSDMYETMISEPYNVRPTAAIHSMMGKAAWEKADLPTFQHHLRAAYSLLKETRRERHLVRSKVADYIKNTRASQGPKQKQGGHVEFSRYRTRSFANAVYEYDILRLRSAQQAMIVGRLVRLLLIKHDWDFPGKTEHAWERRLLPQVIEEWQDFLPDQIHYHTTGGVVFRLGFTNWRFRRFTGFTQVPIHQPDPVVGAEREMDPNEIEDDVFWARRLVLRADLNSGLLPLVRLFHGVVERSTVAHPQPHDPFSFKPIADCKAPSELKAFYREYDLRAARQMLGAQEGELEEEQDYHSEDSSDAGHRGSDRSLY